MPLKLPDTDNMAAASYHTVHSAVLYGMRSRLLVAAAAGMLGAAGSCVELITTLEAEPRSAS